MTNAETASKILDTMLGHLGIPATVELEETADGPCLQIRTTEQKSVIGRDGDRLEDIQYLVNRIVRKHDPDAGRIKVDCEHFRAMREDAMAGEVRAAAERVKESRQPMQMRPLNAYYRRLVYSFLADDPDVEAHSPEGDDRLKRIVISPAKPTS
ncbi:MAG: R3H domain-containing nucleic acid-binding protein [Verrucomicrobiota bacterium]